MSSVMRAIIVGVLCFAVACDPVQFAAFQAAPRQAGPADSTTRAIFALASRVAARHGLHRVGSPHEAYMEQAGWRECFGYSLIFLCGKVTGAEVQFRMWQRGPKFAPQATAVRFELLDSLRRQFPGLEVRECRWRLERDDRRSGCPALAAPAGSGPAMRY